MGESVWGEGEGWERVKDGRGSVWGEGEGWERVKNRRGSVWVKDGRG
jgi:hypothetical protein